MGGDLSASLMGIALLGTLAAPVTLSTSYTLGNSGILNIAKSKYVELGINYTMGTAETANSILVIYEVSFDKTTWYKLQNEASSGGNVNRNYREDTFAAVASALSPDSFPVHLQDYGGWKYLRVSVKESSGDAISNAGTCWIEAGVAGR